MPRKRFELKEALAFWRTALTNGSTLWVLAGLVTILEIRNTLHEAWLEKLPRLPGGPEDIIIAALLILLVSLAKGSFELYRSLKVVTELSHQLESKSEVEKYPVVNLDRIRITDHYDSNDHLAFRGMRSEAWDIQMESILDHRFVEIKHIQENEVVKIMFLHDHTTTNDLRKAIYKKNGKKENSACPFRITYRDEPTGGRRFKCEGILYVSWSSWYLGTQAVTQIEK